MLGGVLVLSNWEASTDKYWYEYRSPLVLYYVNTILNTFQSQSCCLQVSYTSDLIPLQELGTPIPVSEACNV
jgi:hypothetical protein